MSHQGDKALNMDIPDEIRKCVGFVQIEKFESDMKTKYKETIGTAFFVEKKIGDSLSRAYVITARHVIDGAKKKGCEKIFIRGWKNEREIEIRGKKYTVPFCFGSDIKAWSFSDDKSVDAAFLPIARAITSPKTIQTEIFATQEDIDTGYVQLGNDIIITGLFSYHQGDEELEPIIRVGNVAMLPRDKVRSRKFGEMDAYIIEARSIGGLSGSPVFLCQYRLWQDDSTQPDADKLKHDERTKNMIVKWGYRFKFLGLIHGHWDEFISEDELTLDIKNDRVNVGAAIVVPAKHILSMINSNAERQVDEELLSTSQKNIPIKDPSPKLKPS